MTTPPVACPLRSRPGRALLILMLCAVSSGIVGCAQAILIPSPLAGVEYCNAYADGMQTAQTRCDEIVYGGVAFVLGLPLGAAVALYGAYGEANPPSVLLVGKTEEYARGFSAGFEDCVRQKRELAGWVGAGAGVLLETAAFLVLIFAFGHVH